MPTKNDLKEAVKILENRRKETVALLYSYEYLLDKLEDDLIDIDRDLEDFRFRLSMYVSEQGKWHVTAKKKETKFVPKMRLWEEP